MVRLTLSYVAMAAVFSFTFPVIAFADMAVASTAEAQADQGREAFVRGITQQVTGIIHNDHVKLGTKKAQLESMFTHVVDLGWIAQFVLGDAWKNATPQQRSRYVALYGNYLTGTYLAGLDENFEHALRDIKILGMEDAFDDAFLVHTEMVMASANNMRVDYVVLEEAGQRKVVDIVLEGVSLLRTHRSELGALASSKGMDGVIDALQTKMGRKETNLALAR